MIDLKEAVTVAKRSVAEVFASDDVRDLLLEGVDRNTASGNWEITVSFLRKQSRPKPGGIGTVMSPKILDAVPGEARVFKTVHVDMANGEMIRIVDVASVIAAE